MKKILTFLVLPVLIIGIGYAIWNSIQQPVEFNKEKEARQQLAIQKLKDIRTLQVAFKGQYGHFTPSVDSLIDFYNNGQITIVKQIGSMDDSLAVAQKRVRRDSIKIQVKDTLLRRADFNIADIKVIPFSGGKFIQMQALIRPVSGVQVPLFEATIPFNDLLSGLDHQLIVNLNAELSSIGKYPGVKVGSVDAPNNNAGNWE